MQHLPLFGQTIRVGGELPWAVLINGACWGIFRHEHEALVYMGEAMGISPREVMAAIREREVGER